MAQLAAGPGRVKIVCVPSYVYVVGSGQEQFMRLADHFDGVRDVHVCSLPGFGTELSPRSREVAVEVLDGAIRAAVGDSRSSWSATPWAASWHARSPNAWSPRTPRSPESS
ncbi:hypothetical protein NKH77_44090 [Streptomyces sp. M19]